MYDFFYTYGLYIILETTKQPLYTSNHLTGTCIYPPKQMHL